MTTLQILRILWARRMLVFGCIAILSAIGVLVSLLMPKTYTANADVIIDMRNIDPVGGTQPSHPLETSFVATQVDIIESERVSRRVVDALKLTADAESLAKWRKNGSQGDLRNWLASELLKKLDVRPSKESNVVRIMYKDPSSARSALIANAFADAYLGTVTDLKLDPARQNAAFFEDQAKAAREELERAQAKLSSFLRSNNIVAADERLDVENARLSELSTQLVAIQAVLAESRSRASAINARNNDDMQEVLESALIQGLKADIAKLDSKVKEAATRLGTAHPEYLSLQAELQGLRQQLTTETRKYAGSVVLSSTINSQREAQIRNALEAQRARVLRLKAQRDEVAVMQKEVEAQQRAYEQVTQRLKTTTVESLNKLTNVALLTPAVEPAEPSSPKLALNASVAALLGALIGVAMALLLEMRNRRARDVSDLVEYFNLPVLVSVPAATARRRRELLPRATHMLPKP